MTVDQKEVSQRVAEVLNERQKEKERENARIREIEEREFARIRAMEEKEEREFALKREREEWEKREREQLEVQKREFALKREKEEREKREREQFEAQRRAIALKREREEQEKNKQDKQLEAQRKKELEKQGKRQVYFINYRASLTAPYGLMLGTCKRWGGYTQYSESMAGIWEDNLEATYQYVIEGEHRYFRSSFTAGGMVRPVRSWNWFLYAGAGYGKCGATHYYHYNYDYHYYCPHLIKGLELEGGIAFAFSIFNASMGYSTIAGSRFRELHFGLGFKF